MKLSAQWIRDLVDLSVDDSRLAHDLTAAGIAVEALTGVNSDTVFEMEIGTNRPDAMNHYGVAREAAAIYNLPLQPLESKLPPASHAVAFPIAVDEPQLCPRFTARIIRGTTIQPSPERIAYRLRLLDQRPISNAVDATNYVLWEMGKPTHVFDLDLLEGGRLIIRRAAKGEKLKTLDGVERALTSDDLVVADAKKPVALAGVMGGFDTMITEKTRNLLIESAWWDPLTVRNTSRRHGIHTDASHRFERGADFESTLLSCNLVAALILESGGGESSAAPIDIVSRNIDQAPVVLRVSEVRRILGSALTSTAIFQILKKLGFQLIPEGQADPQFRVQIPSWRLDVEREIDLIEEIARLHGYDKFPNTLPAYTGAVVDPPHAAVDETLRRRALALGYNEAVSLTFIAQDAAQTFSPETVALELQNPLSQEAGVMRTSLVPGMLDMLAFNLNRDAESVRLFECGRVYEIRSGERAEPARVCLGTTLAALTQASLSLTRTETDQPAQAFLLFKGDVETLLAPFAGDNLAFDCRTPKYFHPGQSARALMDGAPVAHFGRIAESVRTENKLRQDVYLAEFDLEQLRRHGLRIIKFSALPKYPAVERDFSFVFNDDVQFEAMRRVVLELRMPELRDFTPVEIFRGKSIGAGKFSILLRARLQSEEATLRDDQIARSSSQIISALQQLDGVQRA